MAGNLNLSAQSNRKAFLESSHRMEFDFGKAKDSDMDCVPEKKRIENASLVYKTQLPPAHHQTAIKIAIKHKIITILSKSYFDSR